VQIPPQYQLADRYGPLPVRKFADLGEARMAAATRARNWNRAITIVGEYYVYSVSPTGAMTRVYDPQP
jgi:hypothetical protein